MLSQLIFNIRYIKIIILNIIFNARLISFILKPNFVILVSDNNFLQFTDEFKQYYVTKGKDNNNYITKYS